MTERHLIIVDLETTGLNIFRDEPLEVAALNVTTGEKIEFVPHVRRGVLMDASPEALAINRYYERELFDRMLTPAETLASFQELAMMLKGNTFAGSNPTFDSGMLRNVFINRVGINPQWHHRLADISAITAGVFKLPATELPGLADCCRHFGFPLENYEAHTAMGDVLATAECFKRFATGLYPLPTEVPF